MLLGYIFGMAISFVVLHIFLSKYNTMAANKAGWIIVSVVTLVGIL